MAQGSHHSREKVQHRASRDPAWVLSPSPPGCLPPPGVTSLPSSSPFHRVASRNQRWTFLKSRKVDWQELAPSVNTICLAGKGPKTHRLRPGSWGRISCLRESKAGKLSQQGREFRSSPSGTSCKPFQCLCFLRKAQEVRITLKNARGAGLGNPIT